MVYNCVLTKVDWFAACIALRVVGAVIVVFLRRWRKIFRVLQPVGSKQGPIPVPEFIDPVFTKTSPIRSFSVIQNERFGLVFAKTGSINSGTEEMSQTLLTSKKQGNVN